MVFGGAIKAVVEFSSRKVLPQKPLDSPRPPELAEPRNPQLRGSKGPRGSHNPHETIVQGWESVGVWGLWV